MRNACRNATNNGITNATFVATDLDSGIGRPYSDLQPDVVIAGAMPPSAITVNHERHVKHCITNTKAVMPVRCVATCFQRAPYGFDPWSWMSTVPRHPNSRSLTIVTPTAYMKRRPQQTRFIRPPGGLASILRRTSPGLRQLRRRDTGQGSAPALRTQASCTDGPTLEEIGQARSCARQHWHASMGQ